jgi:outer membrane receptor protein involved in Fe transport
MGLLNLPVNAQEPAPGLEVITVTATRRAEAVESIPYNISALSSDDIRNAGAANLQDLTRLVPGLTAGDVGPRGSGMSSNLIIRGLNVAPPGGGANNPNVTAPLVTTYVDETPMFVNLRLTDIERVEVLRGPQGTLYGSGSMGGTVRLLHTSPNPKAFAANLDTRLSQTTAAGETNYTVEGAVNIPLGDKLALRLSGGRDYIAGIIDADRLAVLDANGQPVLANPADPLHSGVVYTKQKDVDQADTDHLRVALKWLPSDKVNTLFSYTRQEDHAGDFTIESPNNRYHHNATVLSPLDRDVDLFTMDVTVDFGFASFTSASSTYDNRTHSRRNFTGLMETITNSSPFTYGFYPRPVSTMLESSTDSSVVQEFRLVSAGGRKWDWVAGAFYRDQKMTEVLDPQLMHGLAAWSELPGSGAAFDPIFGPGAFSTFGDFVQFYNGGLRPSQLTPTDYIFTMDRRIKLRDTAVFGELTYHISDRWQVTGGVRLFSQSFEQRLIQILPICGAFCSDTGDPLGRIDHTVAKEFDDHVLKFNTSFNLSDNAMIYLTWAEGFRFGGGNALAIGPCALCESDASLLNFDPDRATNLELGIKGRLANSSMRYTLSAYRIQWDNFQIDSATNPGAFLFVLNGGRAETRGLEFELDAELTDKLTLGLGYSYVDARLKSNFVVESTVGVVGDKLPTVPRNQFNLAFDYFQPLRSGRRLQFHMGLAYRDEITSALSAALFNETTQQFEPNANPNFRVLPSSEILNLGVTLNSENWRVGFFANNLTNDRMVSAIGLNNTNPLYDSQFITRPRTYGVTFGYEW